MAEIFADDAAIFILGRRVGAVILGSALRSWR